MASLLECRTAAEVFDNYKAVKSRLRALRPPEPPPRPEPAPEVKPEPIARKIEIVAMPEETSVTVHQYESEPPVVINQHPSVYRIVGAVCEKYGISRNDLLSARRTMNIVRPRQIAMYLAKNLTLKSLPEIGRRFGRDHTTVLHAVRKIDRLRAAFVDYDEELTELENILGGGDVAMG